MNRDIGAIQQTAGIDIGAIEKAQPATGALIEKPLLHSFAVTRAANY